MTHAGQDTCISSWVALPSCSLIQTWSAMKNKKLLFCLLQSGAHKTCYTSRNWLCWQTTGIRKSGVSWNTSWRLEFALQNIPSTPPITPNWFGKCNITISQLYWNLRKHEGKREKEKVQEEIFHSVVAYFWGRWRWRSSIGEKEKGEITAGGCVQ